MRHTILLALALALLATQAVAQDPVDPLDPIPEPLAPSTPASFATRVQVATQAVVDAVQTPARQIARC